MRYTLKLDEEKAVKPISRNYPAICLGLREE
jgi:hypothetical protein